MGQATSHFTQYDMEELILTSGGVCECAPAYHARWQPEHQTLPTLHGHYRAPDFAFQPATVPAYALSAWGLSIMMLKHVMQLLKWR